MHDGQSNHHFCWVVVTPHSNCTTECAVYMTDVVGDLSLHGKAFLCMFIASVVELIIHQRATSLHFVLQEGTLSVMQVCVGLSQRSVWAPAVC